MKDLKTAAEVFSPLVNLGSDWRVSRVQRGDAGEGFRIHVEHVSRRAPRCPVCGGRATRSGAKHRVWLHRNACGEPVRLVCDVPQVNCPERRVHLLEAPWADLGERHTLDLEAVAISELLARQTVAAVARKLGVDWSVVARIMERAVERGRSRLEPGQVYRHLCVDEVAFRKRRRYFTVVSERDFRSVLFVIEGRDAAALEAFYRGLDAEQLRGIQSVAMDMWPACIRATMDCVPDAHRKIAYDHFHVVQHANDAVGETRRREHAELSRDGDQRLRGSRFRLLTGREALGAEERQELDELQRRRLRTGRVWAIKELLRDLWLCHSREEAEERMQRWLAWVQRCRVSAMVRVARMVRRRREGILNAIELRASDGLAEGINSKIRMLKYLSCGFRRRERFQTVVHFHLGKMDLYPDGLAPLPP